jgi:hypothetical protein
MRRVVLALSVSMALLVGGCSAQQAATPSQTATPSATPPATSAPTAQTATPTASATPSMPVQPGPGEWAPEINNPWFPYIPGTTFTYRGQKDGQPTVDTYVVTNRKKMVNGVSATIVINTLRTGAHEIEGTEDWYAQDKNGNVWYLGEATQTFDKNGKKLSTVGSWQAGVDGAKAGLFMPAHPKVGDSYYQEYKKGQAEDTYEVISLDGTITVPHGSYTGALVTRETTVLEPSVVSEKYYVNGIGQVYENDVKGSTEYAKLVKIVKR